MKNCSQKDLIEKCCLETGVNTHTICIWSCGTHYWAYQYKGLSQNTKKNNKKLGLLLQPYHLNIFVYLCIDSSVMVAEWSSWTRRLEQSGAPFLRGLILTERPHASLTEVLKNIWMKERTRPYNRTLRQHSTGRKTTPLSDSSWQLSLQWKILRPLLRQINQSLVATNVPTSKEATSSDHPRTPPAPTCWRGSGRMGKKDSSIIGPDKRLTLKLISFHNYHQLPPNV